MVDIAFQIVVEDRMSHSVAIAQAQPLEQWSPNYGPRAGSGPLPHLDRPPEQYQRHVPIYYFFHLARCR